MRKITSILLLTCFCFFLFGYHLVYYFQLKEAKSAMIVNLKKLKHHKNVVELFFNSGESKKINWENDHEFSYNNEMYDVIEKKIVGDVISIRCISDDNETQLIKEYQKNTGRQSSQSIIQLLSVSFILPSEYFICQPERILKNKLSNRSYPLLYLSSVIDFPPPDGCYIFS